MTADKWLPKIDQYVDAELSAEEMRDMDQHLRECAGCAAEALNKFQLKRATKLAGQRYMASPAFRQRVAQQVAGKNRRTSWWGWKKAFALSAVALILFVVWVGYAYRQARSQQLLTELVDVHVADLAASTPVDVVSSDRHTVKPWFQGKVPFTFNLPEFGGSPFTLVGGRVTYLNHEPGAQLVFDMRSHHISVFIFRDQPGLALPGSRESGELLNFNVDSWSANGLRYFVVGDASRSSIEQLCGLLKQAGNS
jgi:anti-sigma factor RsiW